MIFYIVLAVTLIVVSYFIYRDMGCTLFDSTKDLWMSLLPTDHELQYLFTNAINDEYFYVYLTEKLTYNTFKVYGVVPSTLTVFTFDMYFDSYFKRFQTNDVMNVYFCKCLAYKKNIAEMDDKYGTGWIDTETNSVAIIIKEIYYEPSDFE